MQQRRVDAPVVVRGVAGKRSTAIDPARLLDLTADAVYVRSYADGRIQYWSSGAEAVYGWSAEEAVGVVAPQLLETEFRADPDDVRRQLRRSGRWEGVVNQRGRDGRAITVLSRWTVAESGRDGVPEAVLVVNRDISQHSDVETRMGASEEMFQLMVEAVEDYAIFMLDPNGCIASWNKGAARIKGWTASEIVGKHFSIFYPETDVRAGKPDWELVVAADVGRFEDEGWRVRKDGTRFWANVVITALRDRNGVLRGFGKVTRDLTARRQLELEKLERERREAEAVRAHAARLEELERTKTDFLNLASHELRGPLSVARGYTSMLLDGSLPPQEFMQVAPIVGAKLAQIENLVQKMLETARLDYEQLALAITPVDVVAVVRRQVDAISPLLSPDHQLRLDVPSYPVTVHGDPDRLGTVVLNLLDNAVKYSPDGGLITVKVAMAKGRTFISISDEGLGIDIDDQPKLFTRFGRLRNGVERAIDGTGLGLYISREVARRHGGDIIVESRLGEGSRFTLSLPTPTREPLAAG